MQLIFGFPSMLSLSLLIHWSVYCMLVLLVLPWYFWSELSSMFFSFSMFFLFSINMSFYMLFSPQKPIIFMLNWSHLLLLKSKMLFFWFVSKWRHEWRSRAWISLEKIIFGVNHIFKTHFTIMVWETIVH